MLIPTKPEKELERVNALHSYALLDTLPEEEYDQITQIASEICDTPIALISLIDENRQWFKSKVGIDANETPRDLAFCAYAIQNPEGLFLIEDSKKDERFRDNPLVTNDPNVIFYAGVTLKSSSGHALGTLCVIDNEPRTITDKQKEHLASLARHVESLFELRKKTQLLESINDKLSQQNESLIDFSRMAAHDLKSPLCSIQMLTEVLKEDSIDKLDEKSFKFMDMIQESTEQLMSMIDGVLQYSENINIKESREYVSICEIVEYLKNIYSLNEDVDIDIDCDEGISFYLNKSAVHQVLLNLISNAVEYCDKDTVKVEVSIRYIDNKVVLSVRDNGRGVSSRDREVIFDLFHKSQVAKRNGKKGTGIGLATVRTLVDAMGGEVSCESTVGLGTTFNVEIPA